MVNFAIALAKEAGNFLWDNFGKVKEIKSKGDRNLATELDKKAEDMIVERIKIKYPNHGILAEETEKSKLDNDWLWIIDPLDGTHNYIRNIDIFGVSIGVVFKGDFVLGVIYMPKDDELYVGEKNNGAYKNGKKIYVSSTNVLKECSVSFDSSIRYSPYKMLPVLDKLARNVFNIRMLGSSARVLSYIAEGKLDFAIEFHDMPWDFAGGVCIIKEAQGEFTDLRGDPITHKTIGYIASNKIIHRQILDTFFPQS
ncbi:MAG: inositol monophosphatase [Candidatus Omnitrophica bacterium]|nr:inositol monophosphatase [Candidatus Omnitrophota bacterium]MCM8826109.1 inositol monophosphatase [Candidatus Omnitrophota bacterium]